MSRMMSFELSWTNCAVLDKTRPLQKTMLTYRRMLIWLSLNSQAIGNCRKALETFGYGVFVSFAEC
jgi:hypothetical protein